VCTAEPVAAAPRASRARLVALLRLVAIYAFAGWVYIAANAVVHPESLPWPLTHLLPWPREDSFGIACFIISFGAAVAAAMVEERP
jgi:hypothetical protein